MERDGKTQRKRHTHSSNTLRMLSLGFSNQLRAYSSKQYSIIVIDLCMRSPEISSSAENWRKTTNLHISSKYKQKNTWLFFLFAHLSPCPIVPLYLMANLNTKHRKLANFSKLRKCNQGLLLLFAFNKLWLHYHSQGSFSLISNQIKDFVAKRFYSEKYRSMLTDFLTIMNFQCKNIYSR